MLWSAASDLISVWVANVNYAVAHYGADAVLAFNEPDGCGGGQSCMSVSTAVSAYKSWIVPFAGTVRLGAPAVTNSVVAGQGLDWLKQFLGNCTTGTAGACPVDFIPLHWYGYSDDAAVQSFKTYVAQAYQAGGGRPLWITELGVTGGTESMVESFMQKVMSWLDGLSYVERYAWFMDAAFSDGTGLVNPNGATLSGRGVVYDTT
jgi:hypothetical protein